MTVKFSRIKARSVHLLLPYTSSISSLGQILDSIANTESSTLRTNPMSRNVSKGKVVFLDNFENSDFDINLTLFSFNRTRVSLE